MPKTTPLLNQIVNGLNAIYEFCPTTWNWVIVLSSIYILLQK
jgi:hypothetical protein